MATFADDPRPSESSADLGHAQADNPPDEPDMIEADADTLDTDVEDADLFLGDEELEDLEDDDGLPEDE